MADFTSSYKKIYKKILKTEQVMRIKRLFYPSFVLITVFLRTVYVYNEIQP